MDQGAPRGLAGGLPSISHLPCPSSGRYLNFDDGRRQLLLENHFAVPGRQPVCEEDQLRAVGPRAVLVGSKGGRYTPPVAWRRSALTCSVFSYLYLFSLFALGSRSFAAALAYLVRGRRQCYILSSYPSATLAHSLAGPPGTMRGHAQAAAQLLQRRAGAASRGAGPMYMYMYVCMSCVCVYVYVYYVVCVYNIL